MLWGSFLSVVAARLPNIDSIIRHRSHCPKCQKQLKWFDLIPLFSFLLLRARCRYCQEPISWHYPLIEVATATVLLLLALNYGITVLAGLLALAVSGLIVIAVYDYLNLEIEDLAFWATLIAIVAVVIVEASTLGPLKNQSLFWIERLVGIICYVVVLGGLAIFGRGKWLGLGDLKLGAALGLLLGYPQAIVGLFFGFITGAIIGILLLALKIKKSTDPVPFAPFLAAGAIIATLWGQQILFWFLTF